MSKVIWIISLLMVATAFIALPVAEIFESKQGDASETYPKGFRGGGCTIETGSFLIGFTAYLLPINYEVPDGAAAASGVPARIQDCSQLSTTGELNLTIDLLDRSVREIPISLRLVKSEDGKEREIATIPVQKYTSGIITQSLELSQIGDYTLIVAGDDAVKGPVAVNIPLKVGGVQTSTGQKTFLFTLFFAIIAAGGLYFWDRRRIARIPGGS